MPEDATTRLASPVPTATTPDRAGGVTPRAVLLGLLLIPVLVAWAEYVEIRVAGPDMVSTSVILCVFFALLVLLGVNALVRLASPRLALTPRELLTVYVMGGVGVSPCGIGLMQWLVPTLAARGTGKWSDTDSLVPAWSRVTDPDAAKAFFAGRSSLGEHWHAWAGPVAVWSGFLLALFGVMFCAAVLLRRAWVEQERLQFPLVALPVAVVEGSAPGSPFWRSPLLWLGIAVPAVLQGLAAAHTSVSPLIPYLPLKPGEAPDLSKWFTGTPWAAMGNVQTSFYPFVVGIGYLLSLETSGSCWGFFLLNKLAAVLCFALGYGDADSSGLWSKNPPRLGDQGIGGFLALTAMSVFLARRHLLATLKKALGEAPHVRDDDEALPYRAAWAGLVGLGALLVWFGTLLGMSVGASLAFFGLFLVVVIGFSRIRAEAGVPWGYGPPMGVNGLLIDGFGSANFGRATLGGLSSLLWLDHDYRSTQMPYQFDALKAADGGVGGGGLNARRLTLALLLALVAGIAAGWVSQLWIYYAWGGDNGLTRTAYGRKWPGMLAAWLSSPRPADGSRLTWVGVGFLATLALAGLRLRLPWWPLHPIGFVVANTWTMQWIWMPLLIGWAAKALVLRYGGMRAYRALLPFFYGLILGDYAVSGLLALFYTATGIPGYRTFPV
jgi:hypothetical protein